MPFNHTIVSVPLKWPCRIWVDEACDSIGSYVITKSKSLKKEVNIPSGLCLAIKHVICNATYRQTLNINCILVGSNIVDHSDVIEASPVGATPTTSSFSTENLASMDWAKTTARRDEKHSSLGIRCTNIIGLTVLSFWAWADTTRNLTINQFKNWKHKEFALAVESSTKTYTRSGHEKLSPSCMMTSKLIALPHYWPFVRKTGEFPSQRVTHTEIWGFIYH